MKSALIVFLIITQLSPTASADEPKPNCKLTIRTFMKDGGAKVDIKEVHANSKAECKQLAALEQKTDDEDVSKITVATSFRNF